MRKRTGFFYFSAVILFIVWTTVASANEIVIGYTGPLSGPAAEYGLDCLNGVDMAINEINASGGVLIRGKRHSFRLEKRDDGIKPDVAAAYAKELRKDHKAIAIFNPVYGTMTALMKMNEERRNEFLVMGYTSVPTAAETGNKLTIILTMPFTIYVKYMSDIAWNNGWRKCAMVATAGPYGEAWRKVFGGAWLQKGGTITLDKPANYYTKTDFAGPLAEALATNPDFLLIGGPSGTTALIIEQARAKGFEGGFVLIDQAKLDAIRNVMEKPLNMEGAIGVAMFESIEYPVTQTFLNNYTAQYKRGVTWECVVHYTSMHALAKAIAAAGSADDVRAIRAAFPSAFPMLGDKYPMEVYGIQSNGRLISTPVIQTMRYARFSQTNLYVWWANTQKEFDAVQKMTKGTIPLIWYKMN
ncbi:MAG TPA: ABC transporter substrate-binding protein [Smithellaceae bacterium]|nr:ABC transporter substrate-binding protein [Smithellaceae bacterium]